MVREKEEEAAGIGGRAVRVPVAGPKIWEEKEEAAAVVVAGVVSPG